jgi:hypothetical protein
MDFRVLLGCFSFHSYSGFEVATRLYFPTLDWWVHCATFEFRLSLCVLAILLDYVEWRTGLVATVNLITKEFQPASGYRVFGVCVLATIDTNKPTHGVK